jgi:hypothetical protein
MTGQMRLDKEHARDAGLLRWLVDFGQDIGYAIRTIGKARAFATTAVVTLAIGIGANTAIFGVLNGFFRPLPVPDADRVVVLAAGITGDEVGLRYRFSFPALVDYRAQASVFSDVFGFDLWVGGMGVGGKTSQFVYQVVTGDFFSGLRLRPALGRLFDPGEGEHAESEATVVLGHAYWQRRFGGDPAVVGTIVRINGKAATVVGVAPSGFHGLFNGVDVDGYAPLSGDGAACRRRAHRVLPAGSAGHARRSDGRAAR